MSEDNAPGQPKRWVGIVLAVALVAALALLFWWLSRPGPVLLQGQIEADSVRVAAKIGGRVASVEVEEGARVEAGDLVATLSTPEAEARAGQVQAQVDAAAAMADLARTGAREEQIRAARAQWQAAQSMAELAAESRARIERLHTDGVVPTQRRDEVVAQARSAQAQADAAREAYEISQSAVRPEELRAAEAQVEQARSGLDEVQSVLAEARQLAPVAGEVTLRVVEPGEVVGPGFPLLVITRTDRAWLTLNLREDLMPCIRVGGRLRGRLPALDMRELEFEVHYIAPMADFATWRSSRDLGGFDLRTFEVRARPVESSSELRPGMSVLIEERQLQADW
jgi:HlyD family secretion protein